MDPINWDWTENRRWVETETETKKPVALFQFEVEKNTTLLMIINNEPQV